MIVAGRDVGHERPQHVERRVARLLVRAVDSMAQAERFVLIDIGNVIVPHLLHGVSVLVLAARTKRGNQFGVRREMVFDGLLVAAVDDHDLVGGGSKAFLDDVLDDRPVDDQQHFFRLSFRCRQKTRAHAGCRDKCLHAPSSFVRVQNTPIVAATCLPRTRRILLSENERRRADFAQSAQAPEAANMIEAEKPCGPQCSLRMANARHVQFP